MYQKLGLIGIMLCTHMTYAFPKDKKDSLNSSSFNGTWILSNTNVHDTMYIKGNNVIFIGKEGPYASCQYFIADNYYDKITNDSLKINKKTDIAFLIFTDSYGDNTAYYITGIGKNELDLMMVPNAQPVVYLRVKNDDIKTRKFGIITQKTYISNSLKRKKRLGYLIENNLVEIIDENNTFYLIKYTNPKFRVISGWVLKKDIRNFR